jgi:hydrophobic/amphiphilic exporter-1 (mainly G- bacteria), HAE1 family
MNSRKDDKLSLTFIAHAVRRPVAVAMGGLVILFTGIYTALHLPLEVTPNTDFPRLTVTTSWYDTSPEIMEAFITSPVEAAAARLTGVRNISSRSSEGSSSVTLEFQ